MTGDLCEKPCDAQQPEQGTACFKFSCCNPGFTATLLYGINRMHLTEGLVYDGCQTSSSQGPVG